MREILVPLAAATNALVIGSAFKDDTMMMLFSKVCQPLNIFLSCATQSIKSA